MAKKIMVDGMVFEAGFQGEVPELVLVDVNVLGGLLQI